MKKGESYFHLVKERFFENPIGRVGFYTIVFLILIAVFADFIAGDVPIVAHFEGRLVFPILYTPPDLKNADWKKISKEKDGFFLFPLVPHSPYETNLDEVLQPPSRNHPFGTDDLGRDVFARVIYGTRISLSVGIIAAFTSFLIGVIIGASAGYFGGFIDDILSRFIEIVMCFPTLFLVLTIMAFLPPSIYLIMLVIGLTGWTGIARLVRGEVLKVRTLDFVTSARVIGVSNFKIIVRHIIPNSIAPALVSLSFGVAGAVLTESALSFLGFGVQPPTPSWGTILNQAMQYIRFAWWLAVFPGIAIFITVSAYNMFGEALRDAVDPYTNR